MITAVTGINWGDEGKGRIVDLLSESSDYVVRFQGGNNAGHTVVTPQGKYVLNLLPSGILHKNITCILGDGMVIDPDHLKHEIESLRQMGVTITPENLKISKKATICMPFHVQQDILEEERLAKEGAAFGSTKRGIAYTYGDKYMKKTLRMDDLLHLDSTDVQKRLHVIVENKNLVLSRIYNQPALHYDELFEWCQKQAALFQKYICDTGSLLSEANKKGSKILMEAQLGALRDIDYGIFPYTSSSNTLSAYAPIGAGIPACPVDRTVGVLKAYSTCVGEGPFVAEHAINDTWNETLRKAGNEYGAATGRPRRVGPFDIPASKYGLQCQNASDIALTKVDVLSCFDQIPVITGYEENGKILNEFPTDTRLNQVKPIVEMLPGWNCDISHIRTWQDLPENAKHYIQFLEDKLNKAFYLISVGAQRDSYLLRN